MLTYQKALKTILAHSKLLAPKLMLLEDCLDLCLAQDFFSSEPFPAFDNSAVDGYALAGQALRFKVAGEVRAGGDFKETLRKGEAVRIFTGALIPKGAQTVMMQEDVERKNGTITLLKRPAAKANIRFRGEDFPAGKLLLRRNCRLEPRHLALLSALGAEKVLVRPPATVAILITGSELAKAGEKLLRGKIRDCNGILLETLVKKSGGAVTKTLRVKDDLNRIRLAVREGLKSDLLLVAGGVSVGDYDFVKEVLRQEGVREIFWKVNIKPGKPLFFGEKNQTLVFGLPGNPVSVFVTFEEFVKPTLFQMMGKLRNDSKTVQGYLTVPFQNGPRLHFVRVRCLRRNGSYRIHPLKGQGSHMIGSLASANALLRVEPHQTLEKNQPVTVKIITGGQL